MLVVAVGLLDHHYWAAKSVGVRVIRVVDRVAEWTKRDGRRRRRSFDAWIFELYGPDTEPIRVVSSSNDSDRWAFHLDGEPFPIEATFPYDAPRPRDRFTRKQLRALIETVGATPLKERVLLAAPRFALIADDWGTAGTASTWPTYTLGQLDDPGFMAFDRAVRALGTMQDFPQYASTAVLAMERAISYQPAHEPILRDQLARARRIAARLIRVALGSVGQPDPTGLRMRPHRRRSGSTASQSRGSGHPAAAMIRCRRAARSSSRPGGRRFAKRTRDNTARKPHQTRTEPGNRA